MLTKAKKLVTAVLCSLAFCTMWATAFSVEVYLGEYDSYGVQMNLYGSTALVDTSPYNQGYKWGGSYGARVISSSMQKASIYFESSGNHLIEYTDAFGQTFYHPYSSGNNYTFKKHYSTVTAYNSTGTSAFSGSIPAKVYVGKAGLKTAAAIKRELECKMYTSSGWTRFLIPRIWTGGAAKYSLYVLDTRTNGFREYTYGNLGIYTEAASLIKMKIGTGIPTLSR